MGICAAHHRKHTSNAPPFLVHRRYLHWTSPSARYQPTLWDHG